MPKKKKSASDVLEELEAMGQDSETKAVKWVKEQNAEQEKLDDERKAISQWMLNDKKKQITTYKDALLFEMKRQMIDSYDFLPENFLWYPKSTEKGICLYIRDSHNKWYARGMLVSTVPEYDLQAIERLIDKALQHMDNLEQLYEQKAATIHN